MATPEALRICSNAMTLIAADSVVSFTDGTNESQVAVALYERTLRACLTEHRWNFTIDQFQASQLVTKPKKKWSKQYQLPSTVLVIDKIYPEYIDYDLQSGKRILTNYDGELMVEGVWRVDESQMPDYFLEYLEFRLAAKFAFPITSDMSLAGSMADMAKQAQLRAKSADSKQRKGVGIKSFPLVDVRGGRRYR